MLLTTLWIPCLSQTESKDSSYCLTEPQRRFVLTQAFMLQECDSVSKSLKTENLQLRKTINDDNVLLANQAEQLSLAADRLTAKDADMAFLNDRLKVKDKKIRKLKVGIISIGVVSIVTNVYLLNKALR